jgi:ankyrin repeat protein
VQSLFRMFKPEVSVDQYAPRLRAILTELVTEPEIAVPDPNDQNSVVEYLKAQSTLFERANARRLELEQIKPERRLIPVHDKTVVLCRMTLHVWNMSASELSAAIRGDFAESRRQRKQVDSWSKTLESTWNQLGQLLRRLRAEQPTLFSMLDLPEPALDITIGLREKVTLELQGWWWPEWSVADASPLHNAAYLGDTDAIRELITRGTKPDIQVEDGLTPLHLAAIANRIAAAETLLTYGASTTVTDELYPDKFPTTIWLIPIDLAAARGHTEMVRHLLRHMSKDDLSVSSISAINLAAMNGHADIVGLLLAHGINVHFTAFCDVTVYDDATPLHFAAMNGHVSVARVLLASGANVNIGLGRSPEFTPLSWAVDMGHVQLAELLLAHGAERNFTGREDNTLLQRAIDSGNDAMIQLLRTAGAQ